MFLIAVLIAMFGLYCTWQCWQPLLNANIANSVCVCQVIHIANVLADVTRDSFPPCDYGPFSPGYGLPTWPPQSVK